MKVYPVIHHHNHDLSMEQAAIAFDAGADGVFVIDHIGPVNEILTVARAIKKEYPNKQVGVNLLGIAAATACLKAFNFGLDMIWSDYCGVSSIGMMPDGNDLKNARAMTGLQVFASIAFKYQGAETDPCKAAVNALEAGFEPTTSGAATGEAPTLEKIKAMSAATRGYLAVASGMTPENIVEFAPYLSHVLVATGVSLDFHHFDFERLAQLIALARIHSAKTDKRCNWCGADMGNDEAPDFKGQSWHPECKAHAIQESRESGDDDFEPYVNQRPIYNETEGI